jgi:hypothetical protein
VEWTPGSCSLAEGSVLQLNLERFKDNGVYNALIDKQIED